MFRLPFVVAILATLCASLSAADPGPGLPLFRRAPATPAAPPKKADTPSKLDVPKPFAPTLEALGASAEKTDGDQVDVAEVLRRGDHMTRAGRGPMGSSERTIGDAVSPPADDSHKWFVSIIVERGSKESEALLYDLKHSPDLRAWANPEEARDSWSHVTIYVKGDESQDWRWKNLKVDRYPVMILQPPAKLVDEKNPKSWEWGDPSTVVWQWDGYDATAPERAKLRADALRKVLLAYVTKTNASRERLAGPGPRAKVDRPTPGARQASKPSDNTGAPVFPQTINIPGVNPVQADPTQPSTPTQAPAGPLLQLLNVAMQGFGSGGFWVFILVALKACELWAAATPSKVDDQIVAFFRGIAESQTNKQNP